MLKWIYKMFETIFLGLGLILAGCAVQQSAATGSSSATATNAASGQFSPSLSVQAGIFYPLALGTLNLEGTDLAVTPQQAATLLPLWQTADDLAKAGNATAADQEAAFQQIQDAMTPEQMQAIQSMDLSGQNMPDLAQKLGIGMPGGQATLTPEQQATMDAARANGQPPAGTPGPGGPPGAQGTPMPGGPQGMASNVTPAAPLGMRAGFETAIYQAVIDLLQQKIQ